MLGLCFISSPPPLSPLVVLCKEITEEYLVPSTVPVDFIFYSTHPRDCVGRIWNTARRALLLLQVQKPAEVEEMIVPFLRCDTRSRLGLENGQLPISTERDTERHALFVFFVLSLFFLLFLVR